MRRGRDGSAIEIRRGRLSSTPWRGVIAITWPRWRGRLKEGGGGRKKRQRGRKCVSINVSYMYSLSIENRSLNKGHTLTHLSLIGWSIARARGISGSWRGRGSCRGRREARLIGIHIAVSCNEGNTPIGKGRHKHVRYGSSI
jgi:hypothetical protein